MEDNPYPGRKYREYVERCGQLGIEPKVIEEFPKLWDIHAELLKINNEALEKKKQQDARPFKYTLRERNALRRLVKEGKIKHTWGYPWHELSPEEKVLFEEKYAEMYGHRT